MLGPGLRFASNFASCKPALFSDPIWRQAQAMMQERAVVPTADPTKPSPVLALGNFGGRAAGQGAPGQNDQISLFCRASGVDQRAEISLRGLPVHLAAEIMAGGPLLGVNSSSVLMARIHQAEALSRTKNLSLGNTAAVQAAQASGYLHPSVAWRLSQLNQRLPGAHPCLRFSRISAKARHSCQG
ncbi:hypothetical protein AK812_SmicGene37752 [Symbiodinium microadriaticum]|uniref:Uncharacterized protein n=1 Tax=Symbiodinium microadriaticum TaxID=2951 RepID=A0A1Q9CFH1_SYMMI|nr:hypothetical protein AK812_SmicGene37752 [Symbiodinium microadriaticum]